MGTGATKESATKLSFGSNPSSSRDEKITSETSATVHRKPGAPPTMGTTSKTATKPTVVSKQSSSRSRDTIAIGSTRTTAQRKADTEIKITHKPSVVAKQSQSRVKNTNKGPVADTKEKAIASSVIAPTSKTATKIDSNTIEQFDELPSGSDIHRPVTAAIDFGTTSSGFAFVFEDKPNDVQINKWVLSSSEKEKAPTTVLLKEDKTFHSFGYNAESYYARLCELGQQIGWRYFHFFKMELYRRNKLSRDTALYDVENKPMPVIEILSIVICYFKKEILKAIRLQRPDVSDDDVMYIITVPAIWSDAAKQLMREAATCRKAGIHNDQLRLVLEPEAASVYCSRQRVVKRRSGGDGEEFQPLPVGKTYILCDIGGGTLDMATHEIITDGRLLEKYIARGDDKGGHYFNMKFLEFLEKLFGIECFHKWKTTECGDFLDMERDIEDIKRKVGEIKDDVKLNIRTTLLELHRESTGGIGIDIFNTTKGFSDAISSADNKKGSIILKNSFLRNIIQQTAVAIETYLAKIIKHDSSVKLIFLVGGLAKSPFVRQYIESRFPDCRVVVPEDPGVAVLKGAVLLGDRPQTIASRIARYTYGIGVKQPFIVGKHREEYMVTEDGKVWCRDVFEKLIEKGQILQYAQMFTKTSWVNANLPETKQKVFTTYLYQSTKKSPMYITDDGCSKLGGFSKIPPEYGWPDYFETKIRLIVGEAEFKLRVSDVLGRNYEKRINFLLPNE